MQPANVSPRIAAMLTEACTLDFVITPTESAALALEASLIAEHRPRYNVLLKDDRRHPYALITFSEQYPRIVITRSRAKKDADRLYGPFVNEARLRQLLAVIHATFELRQRKRPLFKDRPCINYDLGRCPGVCQQLIGTGQYAETIAKVDKLLSGRVYEVLEDMRQQMNQLSIDMQYEKAAVVRDSIARLKNVFYDPLTEANGTDFITESDTAAAVVLKDPFVFRDIFAISTQSETSKAALFQIRGGNVVSRLIFSVNPQPNESDEERLAAVISAHYARVASPMEIPDELVLCNPVPDVPGIRRVLTEQRGKAVMVRGTRGLGSIVALVRRNVEFEVSMEQGRVEQITKELLALEDTLAPSLGQFRKQTEREAKADNGRAIWLRRVECFDISHTSGANAVGSMAVCIDGKPIPAEYRRYNLDQQSSYKGHPDDFESIRVTLRRRLRGSIDGSGPHKTKLPFPDLLIIDGGKGQLSAAADVLEELDLLQQLPLISIAKGDEAIFLLGRAEAINYKSADDTYEMHDGIRFVCRIRDEAHRTAVQAHRKRRGKKALKSGLDSVSGLGASKRTALLEHFKGSSEAIANASKEELVKAPSIGPVLAARIFDHFKDMNQSSNDRGS